MEITHTITMEYIPNDVKVIEELLSSAYTDFLKLYPKANLKGIEITFRGGTPSKKVKSEQS